VIHSITDFNSLGWDGIYNGKFLTPNSYWFTAEIVDLEGNVIKKTGNFTLIRD
jgi:gliding motility-associated-like protein